MGSNPKRPASGGRSRVAGRRQKSYRIEPLEPRTMLHGGGDHDHDDFILHVDDRVVDASEAPAEPFGGPAGATFPLSSIPSLHSNIFASVKLYLDFDGHYEPNWGSYGAVSTPVFDRDGNTTTFSDAELSTIQEVWQRVAEDFAPFNIDVTTDNPGNFSNGVALRVSIGGNGSWIGPYGGVAYVHSFTNSIVNTAYVFSDNLGNGNARYVAEAVSHEAGHAFGLNHQSRFDSGGNEVEEYHTGDANWAPIMGVSYYSSRTTWHNGQTHSVSTFQDDMSIIAGSTNGFGYRPDDYGNAYWSAAQLTIVNNQATGAGVIMQMSDLDYFAFTTGAGQISLSVNPVAYGNLDARLELRTATGGLIAAADPSGSLGATITTTVAAGEYRLVVASHGSYGDVGQYTLSGSVQPAVDNTAPVAAADAATTTTNKPVLLRVLENDTDANRLDKSSVTIVSGPGNGTAVVDPSTGRVSYRANSAFSGVDSFTYTVRDAAGNVSNVATVTITVMSPPPTAGQSWVMNMYLDVLGRTAGAGEIAFWDGLLNAGVSKSTISQAMITSRERRAGIVADYYQEYLGRAVDPAGLEFWLNVWQAHHGPEVVRAGLVGSQEFFQAHGGTNAGVIQGLYDHVLGRDASSLEIDYWINVISNTHLANVAHGFITSAENRLSLINEWYQDYLDRDSETAAEGFWLWHLTNGMAQENLQAILLGSGEYQQWN